MPRAQNYDLQIAAEPRFAAPLVDVSDIALAVDLIHEIGPEVAASVTGFFSNEKNRKTIDDLLAQGVTPRPPEEHHS